MGLHELIFLHCGFTSSCTARVDKRFDGYNTLQFISDGHVVVSYDDQDYELRGSWYWPAYPGPRIRMRLADGSRSWIHRYVAFKGPLVAHWRSEGMLPEHPQRIRQPGYHADRFDRLLAAVRAAGPWETRRAIRLLELILLDLAEQRTSPRSPPRWLPAVSEFIDRSPGLTPDYHALACRCGMSLRTLRDSFRRATGMTLHNYAIQQRIAKARQMLGDGDLPIKAVAAQLGYDDVFFFTKQFHKYTGVTPGQYRRSRQG